MQLIFTIVRKQSS